MEILEANEKCLLPAYPSELGEDNAPVKLKQIFIAESITPKGKKYGIGL